MIGYFRAAHPDLYRAPGISSATAELDDLAPVALGGTAFRRGRIHLHGLALFRDFHAQFTAGVGFAIERLRDGSGAADVAQLQHFDFKFLGFRPDVQKVAGMNLSSRFGGLVVALDPAQIAGARSQRPGLEEPGRPEPLVHAYAVHGYIVRQDERFREMIERPGVLSRRELNLRSSEVERRAGSQVENFFHSAPALPGTAAAFPAAS